MSKKTLIHNNIKLSIQLSLDGFSFCTYHSDKKEYEHFTHIPFSSKAATPAVLLEEVKTIFKNETLLHNSYDEVTLIHHNELSTFVPHDHFDETILESYLQHTVKTFNNDYVSYDEVDAIKANNVYIPFVNINNFIFDAVGEFTYLHSSSVFIKNILKFPQVPEKEIFVNVYNNNFQLIVLEQGKLILSNVFNFSTKEDFAYYVLFVAEQLKMDPNTFNLSLFGNIKEEDENYKLLYNYVRNVSIYSVLNTQLGENIHTLPQAHFNLLQLHI